MPNNKRIFILPRPGYTVFPDNDPHLLQAGKGITRFLVLHFVDAGASEPGHR